MKLLWLQGFRFLIGLEENQKENIIHDIKIVEVKFLCPYIKCTPHCVYVVHSGFWASKENLSSFNRDPE